MTLETGAYPATHRTSALRNCGKLKGFVEEFPLRPRGRALAQRAARSRGRQLPRAIRPSSAGINPPQATSGFPTAARRWPRASLPTGLDRQQVLVRAGSALGRRVLRAPLVIRGSRAGGLGPRRFPGRRDNPLLQRARRPQTAGKDSTSTQQQFSGVRAIIRLGNHRNRRPRTGRKDSISAQRRSSGVRATIQPGNHGCQRPRMGGKDSTSPQLPFNGVRAIIQLDNQHNRHPQGGTDLMAGR